MHTIEQLAEIQYPLANKFYKHSRYSAKAVRGDDVYVLRGESGIQAAVILQKKSDGWVFLRSMCVDPQWRRQGLGGQLLLGLADTLAQQKVYCYPFEHLQKFYSAAGFSLMDVDSAPDFIVHAFERYSAQGRRICLMINGQHKREE